MKWKVSNGNYVHSSPFHQFIHKTVMVGAQIVIMKRSHFTIQLTVHLGCSLPSPPGPVRPIFDDEKRTHLSHHAHLPTPLATNCKGERATMPCVMDGWMGQIVSRGREYVCARRGGGVVTCKHRPGAQALWDKYHLSLRGGIIKHKMKHTHMANVGKWNVEKHVMLFIHASTIFD